MLVSAHALDALEPDEAAAVQAHLAGCASCRAAFDDALETAARAGHERARRRAAAGLRDRILTAARATPQERAAGRVGGRTGAGAQRRAEARRRRRPGSGASARSSRRRGTSPPPSRSPPPCSASCACRSATRPSQLRSERDASALVGQVLAAPGAQVVALTGPGGAAGGAVLVVRSAQAGRGRRPAAGAAGQDLGGLDDPGRTAQPTSVGADAGRRPERRAAAGDRPERHHDRDHAGARRRHAARRRRRGTIALSGGVSQS